MKIKQRRILYLAPFLLLFITITGYSQQKSTPNIKYLKTLIEQDSLTKARTLVNQTLSFYRAEKNYDSLVKLISLEGSFKLNKGDKKLAVKKAETLFEEIKSVGEPLTVKEAHTELGWIYSDAGLTQKAYDLLSQAISYANQVDDPQSTAAAAVQYSLGFYASELGNFPLANSHYQKSLRLLKKSRNEDFVFYQQIYNALGGMMWQEAKLDSSKYYFQEAVKVLEKTDEDDIMNRYYRPSLVKMNLAILWNALGKNQEAIAISKQAVAGFQKYIDKSTDESRTLKAKGHQLVCLDNMSTFYNTIGEYTRTEELIEYSEVNFGFTLRV